LVQNIRKILGNQYRPAALRSYYSDKAGPQPVQITSRAEYSLDPVFVDPELGIIGFDTGKNFLKLIFVHFVLLAIAIIFDQDVASFLKVSFGDKPARRFRAEPYHKKLIGWEDKL
jgi:hypothetical protein